MDRYLVIGRLPYTIRHKKRESSAYYLLIATGLYIVTYFIVNHDTEVEEKREVNFVLTPKSWTINY